MTFIKQHHLKVFLHPFDRVHPVLGVSSVSGLAVSTPGRKKFWQMAICLSICVLFGMLLCSLQQIL